MGYRVDHERMNGILAELSEKYRIYGPAFDAQKKRVQYREIRRIERLYHNSRGEKVDG